MSEFIAREEYFGCLIFDRSKNDYISFDPQATDIFKRSQSESLDQIYYSYASKVSRESFDTFIHLCESIGLIQKGSFQGRFLSTECPDKYMHLSAPLKVNLQLTNYCNLACQHCWADSGKPRPRELTVLEIKKLIDEMVELGCYQLHLGGGEPLARGDCVDIIRYANEKQIFVTVSTNATLITKSVAKKLAEVKVEQYKVSFEAANEKSYDFIRGERSFRKAVRGIKSLREIVQAPFYFHVVLQKENLSEIPALVKQATKHGAEKIVFDTLMPVGRATTAKRLWLSSKEANHALDLARRIGSSSRMKVEVLHRTPPAYQQNHLYDGFGSPSGRLHCHISSDGNVASSGYLSRTMPAGNLRETSLKEIWQESKVFRNLRAIQGNPVCQQCDYFVSCRGGSRDRSILILNSLVDPDPYCLIAYEGES